MDNCWTLFNEIIGNSERVLLYGMPGTGKTYQAVKTNVPDNKEVYSTTLTVDSSASEIIGHYIPNEKGTFDWNDGVGIRAWREGTRLVLNEIDHAGPDVTSVLHAILELVQPASGFNVVATMNGKPDDLPEALADRFAVKIDINEVHPEAIDTLPEEYKGAYAKEQDGGLPMSIRAWKEFAKLVQMGIQQETAARVCFGYYASDVISSLEMQDV